MGGTPSPHLQALGMLAVDDRGIVSPVLLPRACLAMHRKRGQYSHLESPGLGRTWAGQPEKRAV